MSVKTSVGVDMDTELLNNYLKNLVNRFFKILPIRESGEESLPVYMESLKVELLGCQGLVEGLNTDASYMTLLAILQYLIDNPECSIREVRREVFKSISICNKLHDKYAETVEEEAHVE